MFTIMDASFLKEWIDSPARNAGFRLVSPAPESAGETNPVMAAKVLFYPDDAPVVANRPRLNIAYVSPISAADRSGLRME